MSRTRTTVDLAAERERVALERAQARWRNLKDAWRRFKRERNNVSTAYPDFTFTREAGPFGGKAPKESEALTRLCDLADAHLARSRNRLAEERRAARQQRLASIRPTVIESSSVASTSGEDRSLEASMSRSLQRLDTFEASEEVRDAASGIVNAIRSTSDYEVKERNLLELRSLVKRARIEQRDAVTAPAASVQPDWTEPRAPEEVAYLERSWSEISSCSIPGAHYLLGELQNLMYSNDPLPRDLDERIGAVLRAQHDSEEAERGAELARLVAAAFADQDEYVVSPDLVDLLGNGEAAMVASKRRAGHGLRLSLHDGNELAVVSVVEEGTVPQPDFADEYCDHLQHKVLERLTSEGARCEPSDVRPLRTIQTVAAHAFAFARANEKTKRTEKTNADQRRQEL